MLKNGCEAGCKAYTGGEIKHHKDCQYYSESLTKIYIDLVEENKRNFATMIEFKKANTKLADKMTDLKHSLEIKELVIADLKELILEKLTSIPIRMKKIINVIDKTNGE